jgi:hypothetical protein
VFVAFFAQLSPRKLMVAVFCYVYRLQVITALENVTLFPQYAPALYSIFRFVLQIFYDGGKLCDKAKRCKFDAWLCCACRHASAMSVCGLWPPDTQ